MRRGDVDPSGHANLTACACRRTRLWAVPPLVAGRPLGAARLADRHTHQEPDEQRDHGNDGDDGAVHA